MRKKLFLISLFFILLFKITVVANSDKKPLIINGVLDLRGQDIPSLGKFPLKGEWKFIWKKFIKPVTPDSTQNSNWMSVDVPSVWNRYSINKKRLTGKGYGTYKLMLFLDSSAINLPMAIKLFAVNSSYKFYVNGKLTIECGVTGKDSKHTIGKSGVKIASFIPKSTEVELLFHVANYNLRRGGFRECFYFGTLSNISESHERELAFELLLFGTILVMGLQYLVIFITGKREKVYLYFALVAIFIGIRMLFLGNRYFIHLFESINLKIVTTVIFEGIIIATLSFALYIRELYKEEFPNKTFRTFFYIELFIALCILFSSTYFSTFFVIPLQIISVIILSLIIFTLGKAYVNKKKSVLLVISAVIIVFLAAIEEILYDFSITPFASVLPIALVILLILQALLLSKRTALMDTNIELLSDSIKDTNIALNRFVPKEFLRFLNKESITDVMPGDQVIKTMSSLHADIRSFTSISEKMTPQENFNFLNRYFNHIWPSINDNNGFIDKYIGDAVFALFPNSSTDAVRAAISMQSALVDFNYSQKSKNIPPISIGIGIHCGEVMLGTVGHLNRMETAVISDVAYISTRLENLTKLYGAKIIISKDVLNQIDRSVSIKYRKLDTIKFSDNGAALEIVEILNGLSTEEYILKTKSKDTFENGIVAYSKGDIEKALLIFNEVLDHNEYDKATQFYIKRCKEFIQSGITENWLGIQSFNS